MRCTATAASISRRRTRRWPRWSRSPPTLPLIAQPGAEWNYSISTDVLGHLVAVISGKPFDQFLRERVTGPLGMVDTEFHVPADKLVPLRRQLHVRGRTAG